LAPLTAAAPVQAQPSPFQVYCVQGAASVGALSTGAAPELADAAGSVAAGFAAVDWAGAVVWL
jgi:hypothetical protein